MSVIDIYNCKTIHTGETGVGEEEFFRESHMRDYSTFIFTNRNKDTPEFLGWGVSYSHRTEMCDDELVYLTGRVRNELVLFTDVHDVVNYLSDNGVYELTVYSSL